MLNIPETVKSLYKQDNVKKNFRCHFPNGEFADITNADIVRESVRFQESVCSRDVFRFGLAEASVIEFETVGVGNMLGMTIECSNEIDCSSLSAAEIADIEAGTWDGEYVPAEESDLDFPFFRVPYGVFAVDSCPRNHEAMAHRKVTAYTQTISNNYALSPYLQMKMSTLAPTPKYRMNLELFLLSSLAKNSDNVLLELGFTVAPVDNCIRSGGTVSERTYQMTIKEGSGLNLSWYRLVARQGGIEFRRKSTSETWLSRDLLYNIIFDHDCRQQIEYINSLIGKYGRDYIPVFGPYWYETAITNLGINVPVVVRKRLQGEQTIHYSSHESLYGVYLYGRQVELSPTAIYDIDEKPITIQYYESLTVQKTEDNGETWQDVESRTFEPFDETRIAFEKVTPPDGFNSLYIELEPTSNQKSTNTSEYPKTKIYYAFTDAIDYAASVNGWLETNALFLKADRKGSFSVKRLTPNNPIAILPENYSSMWWDEFDVLPVGKVKFAFGEGGDLKVVEYAFGDGPSVYDMTDNSFFRFACFASADEIQSYLDQHFIPSLDAVNFTPVDLVAKGMPYIEAGDALVVTAQDGTEVETYNLTHNMEGVQSLTAQIDSQNGFIIDSEEGV